MFVSDANMAGDLNIINSDYVTVMTLMKQVILTSLIVKMPRLRIHTFLDT